MGNDAALDRRVRCHILIHHVTNDKMMPTPMSNSRMCEGDNN